MTQYYIHMKDGRVIAGTSETKDNLNYRPIDVSYALAIRDGKVTAEEVISEINAKSGTPDFSALQKAVTKLNVRSTELCLEEHAQGGDASVAAASAGVLGKFAGRKSEAAPAEPRKAAKVTV